MVWGVRFREYDLRIMTCLIPCTFCLKPERSL